MTSRLRTKFLAVLLLVSAFAVAESASYRQVGPIKDVGYAGIKRVSARIVIRPGLSRHELENILRNAAVDIGRRERASATIIFAYRPEDVGESIPATPWTVGRAVYAPNGRWEDAGKNGPMKVSIEVGEVYFRKAPTSIPKRGDEVLLFAANKKSVKVSRSRDAWEEAKIVAKVPNGTRAHVVERYEQALTQDFIFVRYLVKTKFQGKTIQGWVFGDQVKEIAGTFDQWKLVKQVQEQLIAEGFDPGPADGILGLQTKKALRSYQAKHGLSLTGELDGTTLRALGLSDHK
jgi:hypothetical protein